VVVEIDEGDEDVVVVCRRRMRGIGQGG